MATVTAFIRTTADKNKSVNVRFRLRDGRDFQLFHKSNLSVIPDKWDATQQKIKARCIIDEQERNIFDTAVNDRKALIKSIYLSKGKTLTSESIDVEIDRELNPEQYETPHQSFFDTFNEFLEKRNHIVSNSRMKHYSVLLRTLQRYELYTRKAIKGKRDFALELDSITLEILQDFTEFLKNEHSIRESYPEIYEQCRQYHKQKPRGKNTISAMLKMLRTFFIWCVDNEKTTNNNFKKHSIEEAAYGTPFYITIEERTHLYNTDLSHCPALEKQRDIFVFQCLIGCRVSDLYKFTKQNIINGAIEYIARKTQDDNPVTVRVPLNSVAKEILRKYSDYEGETLLPYISEQKYNQAIKEMFTVAGLTRSVTTLDTLTRQSIFRPLNEIASSHLARRCFVGNLYKQVKDPNLVGALSGHKEGSRAFARYREIDEDLRNELVKMLE